MTLHTRPMHPVAQLRHYATGRASDQQAPLFKVLATQNPIEHNNTHSLPEAQIAGFLMKVSIGDPAAQAGQRPCTRAHRTRLPSAIAVRDGWRIVLDNISRRVTVIHRGQSCGVAGIESLR